MTTSTDPDEIRRQIEATRAGLSDDVNALSDKVSPGRIVQRQRDKIIGTATTVKDRVMGSAEDAKDTAGQAVSTVQDTVTGAPAKVKSQTKGSPMAAGLIAFGAGLLVSSLFPASQKEAQAAAALKEKAEPLIDEVTAVAKETAGNLQEPAQQALESVKSTATDAVDTVKEEGTAAVTDVKDQAQDAKDTVQKTTTTS